MEQTFKAGDRVTKPGYGYRGEVIRLERKFRTDWVVVMWAGRPFTEREQAHSLAKVEDQAR